MEHRRIDIGDARLACELEGDGPPVLLIAGLGGRLAFWRRQREALARQFRLILHDHRGTGASTRSDIEYTVAQMSDDVLRLMDALGLERAHLVGHSTGGAIVQHIALHAPERAGRLVLSATWPGPDPVFRALFALRSEILARCGPRAYLVDGILRALPPAWLQARGDGLDALVEDRLAEFPGEAIEQSRMRAVSAFDLRGRTGDIAHPALVICAADDQITPVGFSRELAARIPGARLHVLETGGHFCPQVMADAYNAVVGAFLADG